MRLVTNCTAVVTKTKVGTSKKIWIDNESKSLSNLPNNRTALAQIMCADLEQIKGDPERDYFGPRHAFFQSILQSDTNNSKAH